LPFRSVGPLPAISRAAGAVVAVVAGAVLPAVAGAVVAGWR